MRNRTWMKGALAVTAGIALALTTAVLPAAAAKGGKPGKGGGDDGGSSLTSLTCESLHERTFTADSWSEFIALDAGETLSVQVSPAREGDKIYATVSGGGFSSVLDSAPAVEGYAVTAGSTAVHHLGLSLGTSGDRPASVSWTFDCSSGGSGDAGGDTGGGTGGSGPSGPSDADGDGVLDGADQCSGTSLPDSVKKAVGYYYATASGSFVDGTGRSSGLTVEDTAGCSATQIAQELKIRGKAARSGITLSTLQSWAASH